MSISLKSNEKDKLFEAIALLKTTDEFYDFFEDLCTIPELESMAQRFSVALFLSQGKTYAEIAALTGAATATISRVNRCLSYGADGYNLAIKRLDGKDK